MHSRILDDLNLSLVKHFYYPMAKGDKNAIIFSFHYYFYFLLCNFIILIIFYFNNIFPIITLWKIIFYVAHFVIIFLYLLPEWRILQNSISIICVARVPYTKIWKHIVRCQHIIRILLLCFLVCLLIKYLDKLNLKNDEKRRENKMNKSFNNKKINYY